MQFSTRAEAHVSEVSEAGDTFIGPLSLRNGHTVWLQARQGPMLPDDYSGVAAVEREFRGFRTTGPFDDAFGLGIVNSLPIPMSVELPMGNRHITIVDKL
jgi:hypothetical protein